ncbi:MAG: RNA polymerase sigma factor [Candidatus Riflebacteria bacterium]|nr:RNA polymerase sigma factor [Candidatus Riflebacteria bacterium]
MYEAAAAAELPDEQLADLVSQGDRAAFDSLVRRHHRRVFSICYRMTGSAQEAEDMAQETFFRLYRHRESYQTGRRFKAWLDRICVNVCLTNQQRVRRLGPVVRLGQTDASSAAGIATSNPESLDPEARAGVSELIRSVQKIVTTLPTPYRAALVLRVFGGLSYQEIADALECSIGTVMSRINRARIQVRNHLKDQQ